MKTYLTTLAAAALVCGCTQNVEQASKEFDRLPAAVQQTVRSKAPTAEIAGVQRFDRNGRDVYRIKFRDTERHPAMDIAADGMIVKYEAGTDALGTPGKREEVQEGAMAKEGSLSALPLEVQQAINRNAPKADVANVHRTEENGRVIYDVEYMGKEPRRVLRVTADGQVLKTPAQPGNTKVGERLAD